MPKLSECLSQAARYWATKRDGDTMALRARTGVAILGSAQKAETLGMPEAIRLLERLKARGLSPSSQASYYAAFRRMLALNGIATTSWPAGPVPPRRPREPLSTDALIALKSELVSAGNLPTAHLATLLAGTGMRVEVEALSFDAWSPRDGHLLHIAGKGGHERLIPVADPEAWAIATDPELNLPMRRVSYRSHARHWKAAAERAGITTRLPTPHAVRHFYATEAYRKCKDIRVVQDLLGHADYATTARYIGVDVERMRNALQAD